MHSAVKLDHAGMAMTHMVIMIMVKMMMTTFRSSPKHQREKDKSLLVGNAKHVGPLLTCALVTKIARSTRGKLVFHSMTVTQSQQTVMIQSLTCHMWKIFLLRTRYSRLTVIAVLKIVVTRVPVGAGGRAHKDCPMSSRNRYPSRILFPGGSSAVPVSPRSDKPCKSDKPGSTVSDAGSSMLGKREKPKQDQPPPRCSTSSYTYKVGDRVCIHTHRLDKHHIPCRVALVVGKKYQLYCHKGILKGSYVSQELKPLCSDWSVSLEGWRVAAKISVQEIASDPACLEKCYCILDKSTTSITDLTQEDSDTVSEGEVKVYDSMYPSVSTGTLRVIASLIFSSASQLVVKMMNVGRQSNGSDCGVLAIAFAYDICSGSDPCKVKFDHRAIRQHLANCLEKCSLSRFPIVGERRSTSVKCTQTVDLHCSCRLPKERGYKMAECDVCKTWYHQHCLDIASDVFGDSEVPWKCKVCVDCD